jgi:hypothetical protein
LWRRPRPKLGCGAKGGEGERERDGLYIYRIYTVALLYKEINCNRVIEAGNVK